MDGRAANAELLGDAIQIEASVRRQGPSENAVTQLPHRALPDGAPDRLSQRARHSAESSTEVRFLVFYLNQIRYAINYFVTKTTLTNGDFRRLIGRFATGVTVVTTNDRRTPYGTTASAMTSVSLDPPTLLVCMNRASETGQAIERSGHFAVNVLAEGQDGIARDFARKGSDFSGHASVAGRRGDPLFTGALAAFECRVVDAHQAGTHTIVVGAVESATGGDGMPLAYFCGMFGRLSFDDAEER